jgi:CHAD domain-containing protein
LITPQSYTQSLSKSEKLVSDKVRAYIREPSEENVHDLRTSIRRLLTTASVLPKTIRRQGEFKRHLESYAKLLRLNAKVRDVDIILAKLPHHGDDPNFSILATQLKEIRDHLSRGQNDSHHPSKAKRTYPFGPEISPPRSSRNDSGKQPALSLKR